MKKSRWLIGMMSIAMLLLASFQVYWLRDNYNREARSLDIKAQSAFKETIDRIRDSMQLIKLKQLFGDSVGTLVGRNESTRRIITRIGVLNDDTAFSGNTINGHIKIESATSINKNDVKLRDSLLKGNSGNITVLRKNSQLPQPTFNRRPGIPFNIGDTLKSDVVLFRQAGDSGVSLTIDSFRLDTIPHTLLYREFSAALQKEKIAVDFSITNTKRQTSPDASWTATIPTRHHLELKNTNSYLLKKISTPILFSLFLVGITAVSFILLYRNLVKQQRLGQLKNDLISNITHELKTPIATVGVAIEALKNFNAIQDTARTQEYLAISQNELQRLNLLVDKVLKLSMFETKEVEIQIAPCNIKEIVEEVIASLRLQIEKYNATIHLTTTGDMHITADRLHLLSVIFNLLDNALKYSKESPIVNVAITDFEKKVVMKIEDKGIGIPAHYKEKVFEKFFRVPTGDKHNAKGHGLGLSYVAQVMQKHGGTIELESVEGIGSTFTLTFPKSLT